MNLFTTFLIGMVMLIPVAGFSQVATVNSTKRILVLCTGNSARSQMTQGFLKSFNPALEVYSAGTAPSPRINPFAVQVMKELEIDISAGTPKNVKQFLGESFDYLITVCDDADKSTTAPSLAKSPPRLMAPSVPSTASTATTTQSLNDDLQH